MVKQTNKIKVNKLWGASFEADPNKSVIKFTAGKDVYGAKPADYKLLAYDIWGNQAHAAMLYKTGIINKKDAQIILKGLKQIEKLAINGKFKLDPQKEDVHTNIESWLIEKYGLEKAGKLHTARSRNDQINLDTRLYLKDQNLIYLTGVLGLVKELIKQSKKHQDYLMPGFTHYQPAMVTTLAHIWLAFASMLVKDAKKFIGWFDCHDNNPLGGSVAYGTSLPIDQQLTTKWLGFKAVEINSMDQITNRWEAEADLAYSITSLMNHLSLMAQTLIVFNTPEFGMIKLDDQFCTGSSIMPQKKNPDSLEVIKGKAGLAAGSLQSLISMGKGNFIGYNRDSQWTKYVIMDLAAECVEAPKVLEGVIKTLKADKDKMKAWSQKGFKKSKKRAKA